MTTIVHLVRSGPYWRAWWFDPHGRRRWHTIGLRAKVGKRAAAQACAEIQADFARDPRRAGITHGNLSASELVAWAATRRGGRTAEGYRTTANLIGAEFGAEAPHRITRQQATAFRDSLAESGLSEQTIRNHCGRLRTVWSDAIKSGALAENVWDHLPRGVVAVDKSWDYITHKQVDDLVAESDRLAAPYLVLARYAGLRASEIGRATWADYDAETHILTVTNAGVRTTKRRFRTVPLTGTAHSRILELHHGSEPLIGCTPKRARELVSCPWADPFQNLRRSWISDMASILAPADVAEIAGNSVDVIMGYYHKIRPETVAKITGIGG